MAIKATDSELMQIALIGNKLKELQGTAGELLALLDNDVFNNNLIYYPQTLASFDDVLMGIKRIKFLENK